MPTVIMDNTVHLISRYSPISKTSRIEEIMQASAATTSVPFRIVASLALGLKLKHCMLPVDVAGIFKTYSGRPAVGVEDVDNLISPGRTSKGNRKPLPKSSSSSPLSNPRHKLLSPKKTTTRFGLPKTCRSKIKVARTRLRKTELRPKGRTCHHQHDKPQQGHKPRKGQDSVSLSRQKPCLHQHPSLSRTLPRRCENPRHEERVQSRRLLHAQQQPMQLR